MSRHNQIGKWGENVACNELVAKGYAIIERNWRINHYEVDIIAKKGNRIVFIEVKVRAIDDYDIREVFTAAQQTRIARVAHSYVRMFEIDLDIQFDFIFITGDPYSFEIEHLEDVYVPALKTYC